MGRLPPLLEGGPNRDRPLNRLIAGVLADISDGPNAIGEIDLGLTALLNAADPTFLAGISYNIHSDMLVLLV